MANEAVFKYLVDTNRPYSCADVTVNLRGAYTKSSVQKALDALSESGKIKCKLYGKQKVYAAIQEDNVAGDDDIEDFDTQFKTLTEQLKADTDKLKQAESNLKNLTLLPTTDNAKSQIEEIKNRIETSQKKLDTLKSCTEVISAEEKKSILEEHDKFLREYRKRKRMCTEILDAILEGYPKSKKSFLEELCVETDETVGFKVIST